MEHDSAARALAVAPADGHWGVIPLLAAGHLALAAVCSPIGVRSGAWAVAGFPDPDFLVYLASGATLACPLILYAMWAGLGTGNLPRRYGVTLLMCSAFVGVLVLRAMSRDHGESAWALLFALTGFTLMTLAFWGVQRLGGWRIHSPRASLPAKPIQFRLRLLFALVALAAGLSALYRLRFPGGVPAETIADWWREVARIGPGILVVVTVLLPTALAPCLALRSAKANSFGTCGVAVAVAAWVAWDFGAFWFLDGLGGFDRAALLWQQAGASATGLASALALRAAGYRLI